MIINNFKVSQKGLWIVEEFDVSFQGKTDRLFYAIPEEYKESLCSINADAMIVGLIQIATKFNEDIVVEERPVSQQLINNMETILVPAFNKMGCGSKSISIVSEQYDKQEFAERCGATGISLGVDSCYSILTRDSDRVKIVLSIEDCTYEKIESGSSISDYIKNYKKKAEFSRNNNLQFIPIISNVSLYLCKVFAFEQVNTFFHLSAAMTLMNSIDEYHYASSNPDSDAVLAFTCSSDYDVLTRKVINYDSFCMYTSGGDVTRVEKTIYLAGKSCVYPYLDVCLKPIVDGNGNHRNCSKCAKCIRTMSTLDVIGKLESFEDTFDIEYYKKHKAWYWGDVYYHKIIMGQLLSKEITEKVKENKYHVPAKAVYYFFKKGIGNQVDKLKRIGK